MSAYPLRIALDLQAASQIRADVPITDKHGKIFALYSGPTPAGATVMAGVTAAAKKLALTSRLRLKLHRRGYFRCVKFGYSFGNGQTVSPAGL